MSHPARSPPFRLQKNCLVQAKRVIIVEICKFDLSLLNNALINSRWCIGAAGAGPDSTTVFFMPDGTIEGYGDYRWVLSDFLAVTRWGVPVWHFHSIEDVEGKLTLRGVRQDDAQHLAYELSQHIVKATTLPTQGDTHEGELADGQAEAIRLVIWDLDDTFWRGTLSEEGVEIIKDHIDIVIALTKRGIVNSVCSKNNYEKARLKLEEAGIWQYFVFPRIEFSPKGAMVQSIVRSSQLREETILFIDDNVLNVNEVKHYCPRIRGVGPEYIATMLDDPHLHGKPDEEMARLARYRVLELKDRDRQNEYGDNVSFLRQSQIRISFHDDVSENFARIHDLVNRTNQLNFTKIRWPEDETEARAIYTDDLKINFNWRVGYIKVSDRYGYHGIVGFFAVFGRWAKHFLFSCRTMNMGVEQFAWRKLGRPHINGSSQATSSLGFDVDWIEVVDDAENVARLDSEVMVGRICMRGPCDLQIAAHYLQEYSIIGEHAYPFRGWAIHPAARLITVGEEERRAELESVLLKVPSYPRQAFASTVLTGEADHYVLSFSLEILESQYQSKSTGLILPLNMAGVDGKNFSSLDYKEMYNVPGFTLDEDEWHALQDEFEFFGANDPGLLRADLINIFGKLTGKHIILLKLNENVGDNRWTLDRWKEVNQITQEVYDGLPQRQKLDVDFIDLNEFVRGPEDLDDPNGAHFARHVYRKVADRIKEVIGRRAPGHYSPAAADPAPVVLT
jgi:FkbH-like protein